MIRDFREGDLDAVVALSLRAWAPVFVSLENALGGIFRLLHPDWRVSQEKAVRDACAVPGMRVWVAAVDSAVAGFVAARLDHESGIGEVYMIAVDPDHQRQGIASALLEVAQVWFAERGMTVAMIDTGGDPGHAPARAVYERTGFTPLPITRYFKQL